MPNTPNRSWPYPRKGKKPWFSDFQGFADAIDLDTQSNVDDIASNASDISSLQASLSGVQSFKSTGSHSFTGGGGPYSITTDMSGYRIDSPISGDVLELPAPSSGLAYFVSCTGGGSSYVVLDASANGGTIYGPFQTYSASTWDKMRIYGMPNWVFVYAVEVSGAWNWVVWGGTAKIMNDDDIEEWMNLSFYPEDVLLDRTINARSDMTGAGRLAYKWYSTVFASSGITIEIASELISTQGWTCTIIDSGGAAANNITISTEGAEKIVGNDTYVIDGDYNSVTLVSDGRGLFIK